MKAKYQIDEKNFTFNGFPWVGIFLSFAKRSFADGLHSSAIALNELSSVKSNPNGWAFAVCWWMSDQLMVQRSSFAENQSNPRHSSSGFASGFASGFQAHQIFHVTKSSGIESSSSLPLTSPTTTSLIKNKRISFCLLPQCRFRCTIEGQINRISE